MVLTVCALWKFSNAAGVDRRSSEFSMATNRPRGPIDCRKDNYLHDMENKVSPPKKEQVSGFAGFITFGVICTILLGLVVSQPKAAAIRIAAGEAWSSKTTGEAASARSAAEPMRKPLQPTAWTQVIDSTGIPMRERLEAAK